MINKIKNICVGVNWLLVGSLFKTKMRRVSRQAQPDQGSCLGPPSVSRAQNSPTYLSPTSLS